MMGICGMYLPELRMSFSMWVHTKAAELPPTLQDVYIKVRSSDKIALPWPWRNPCIVPKRPKK